MGFDTRMDAGTLPLESVMLWVDKDDFESKQLLPEWNFLRNPGDGDWFLEEQPGWLILRGSETTLHDIGSPAFVGRRQQHLRCAVSTLLSFEPVREGEEAGLTMYMNERFRYEIALTCSQEGDRKVIFRRQIGSLWKVELEEKVKGSDFILQLEAEPSNYSFFYSELNGERKSFGSGECSLLSTEEAGGFTGVYFGLYATGNGRPCTVPAFFDWFQYIPQDNKE
jgi:xylan 1,4-beta-xylosidase